MNTFVSDLHGHQAWADARHWRAFEAHAPALEDVKILGRPHHIHLVQHPLTDLIVWYWKGRPAARWPGPETP